jgi:hypothetical protein
MNRLPRNLNKIMRYKTPLRAIKTRGTETQIVMETIANGTPPWLAPGIILPDDFLIMLKALTTQENLLSVEEARLAVAASEWDNILGPWHAASVTVLKLGRAEFRGTPKGGGWSHLKANGQSRDRITKEGTELENTWKEANPAWVPKPAITFATFQGYRTNAETKARAFSFADKAVANERDMLITQANAIYDVCVAWYELAAAYFGADTPQGILIRTIPTNYNPDQTPGRLRFPLRASPTPGALQLKWVAARGERFNIYGKAPNSNEFVKLLDHVTVKEWVTHGLTAGIWAFKGEAINADGLGEMSEVIVVPVIAAQVA